MSARFGRRPRPSCLFSHPTHPILLATKKKEHPRERNRVSFSYLPRQRKISCKLILLLLTDAPPRSNCALPKKSRPPGLPIAPPTTCAAQSHIGCAACGGPARRTKPDPLVSPHRSRANVRTAASADLPLSHRVKLRRGSNTRQRQPRRAPKPSAPATHAARAPIPPLVSRIASHSLPESESSKTIVSSGRLELVSQRAAALYQLRKLNPPSSNRRRKKPRSILLAP